MLDGTTESPREITQKTRGTLMSLQEYEIPRVRPNQLKIKPYFPALAPEQFPFPIRHDKWLDFEIPWDTRLKTLGTPISA